MAEEDGERPEMEQRIETAISTRVQHFKDQADSLTMESVRRLLEKDLGLEKFALDAHKRFIRQYLEKKMDSADDDNLKTETDDADKDVDLNKEAAATSPKLQETKPNLKKSGTGDEEMMEDSPIMGVLSPKSEADAKASSVSEGSIKKAIWERADHFLANSENLTLAGVRRLLEEDLGLAKNTLDPFKKFISQQIDQVLNPAIEAKPAKDVKKKTPQNIKSKKMKEISRDESNYSGSESDVKEDKKKSRKEATSRRNVKKVEPTKKRKVSDLEVDGSGKETKLAKRKKGEDKDTDADGSLSEDDQSQSSAEKPVQRKESTPAHGERVEDLKSVIKACGMSVPPSIYKKAKQVPDNKREAFLAKELEEILLREGLSKNPTEKEIKNCKKRKETARELEGIDMSNIISSSRRRSTFSFATPVKPEIRSKKDEVAAKESKSKDKNDKAHNDDNDKEEKKKENEEDKKEKVKDDERENEKGDKEGDSDEEEEEAEEEEEDDAEEEEDDEEEEEEESDEFNEDDSD